MKHGVLFATVGALAFALTAQAVTVDGHVFLSGQTDHAGTRIVFAAVSPSAHTDSTLSVGDGHFSLVLQPGVYDVEYSNDGYASMELEDQLLLFDTTLETQQLMPPLSGNLSGILGPGNFDVEDTIRVVAGDSLRIVAGTRLYFRANVPLVVRGGFHVTGTLSDSVLFTSRWRSDKWSGIDFETSPTDTGRFEYAVFEYAHIAVGGDRSGGMRPSVVFDHCTFRYNGGLEMAGGPDAGWGLEWAGEYAEISNTVFHNNYASSAIYSAGGLLTVRECRFAGNFMGIYGNSDSESRISRCYFSDNQLAVSLERGMLEESLFDVSSYGLGLHCTGQTTVTRCTFRDGIHCDGDGPIITGNIIAFKDRDYSPGILFSYSEHARVEYNCIYGNAGGAFSGDCPLAFGVVALTNTNGDSCDTYYNIFLDPMFMDTGAGDYHLTAGSPCIDAGDPALPHDPDGTVADMGAFYFNQLASPEPERTAVRGYKLVQNYPNPFNAETKIGFELARAGEVTLDVFDITGRLVRRLVDGRMAEGTHEVNLDARDLPSGVYVYCLAAGEVSEAKKMIVLK